MNFAKTFTALTLVFCSFMTTGCSKDSDITVIALGANYYVSATGNDLNPGTFEKPFKSIEYALSKCTKGNELVYVMGGVYKPADNSQYCGFKLSETHGKDADNRIKIWAYPNQRVVLDCSSMTSNTDGIYGLSIEVNYLHIKGFDVINLPQNRNSSGRGFYNVGILIKSNYVTLENCTSHENGGTGIHIGGSSIWVYLRNCDAYNNYDPYTYTSSGTHYPGGNADGFHVTAGEENANFKMVGCRAWNNSDDGYDFFGTTGFITMDSCWAFRNGYLADDSKSQGDGSGIKLGLSAAFNVLKKEVTHCLAVYNRMEGFTQNSGYVLMKINNNTACGNGSSQFDFANKLSGTQITLSNNISAGKIWVPHAIQTNNNWTLNLTANEDDFKSTDMTLLKASRKPNGNLPENDAFRLKSTSDLKGLGAF